MKHWDRMEQEYIFDHGWRIDADEMLILTAEQFRKAPYTDHSFRDKKIKSIMIPSIHSCCLILEGKHFRVEN